MEALKIPLSRGLFALIDEGDRESISQFKWYAMNAGQAFYAARKDSGKMVLMHRSILSVPKGVYVDHINGDSLDNRRCNLRLCTNGENQQNRGKHARNKAGFKGVFPNGRNWAAMICMDGKREYLGTRKTPEEAYALYEERAKMLHGEFYHP